MKPTLKTISAAVPLHNEEIEQLLLGCLLARDHAYDEVTYMRESYFYLPVHARIYEHIRRFKESGQIVTPQTLGTYFEKDADLQHVGGGRYLVDLAQLPVSTTQVRSYAETIYQLHLRRAIRALSQNLWSLSDTASMDETPDMLIARAEKFMLEASEMRVKKEARSIADDIAGVVHRARNPQPGISTGIKCLDRKIRGFQKGKLYIIAARPSMGKSALMETCAINAALAAGRPMIFTFEMGHDEVVKRALSRFAEQAVHSGDVESWEAVDKAALEAAELPIWIDDATGLTAADISARARRHKRIHGLDILFIDYLGLVQALDPNMLRVHQLEEITRLLKNLAKELEIPVVLLSQLSRALETREDKRPVLSDLRDSGSIEQDADVVIFLYRHEYYLERERPRVSGLSETKAAEKLADHEAALAKCRGEVTLIIAKQRDGGVGMIDAKFDPIRQYFYD